MYWLEYIFIVMNSIFDASVEPSRREFDKDSKLKIIKVVSCSESFDSKMPEHTV